MVTSVGVVTDPEDGKQDDLFEFTEGGAAAI
jgi:hypothetical protein